MSLGDSLAAFVRWVCRDTTYHRLYPSVVQAQNLDGSIDVLPEDEGIRGQGLTVYPRPGLPGTEVEAAIGARCLVGFEAGDPRRPYIAEWETGGLGRIGFDRGTRPVARMGDSVEIALPPTILASAIVKGVQILPGPPPTPVPIPPPPAPGVPTDPPGLTLTIAVPPTAQIASGNPKILA